jgi:hypothetical protein
MDALILAAALFSVDAEVRRSEAFALAGELGRFPPPVIIDARRTLAFEHLRYVRALRDAGYHSDHWYEHQQDLIDDAYLAVGNARRLLACHFQCATDPGRLGMVRDRVAVLKRLIGGDDYFYGRLPAPLPCMDQP